MLNENHSGQKYPDFGIRNKIYITSQRPQNKPDLRQKKIDYGIVNHKT